MGRLHRNPNFEVAMFVSPSSPIGHELIWVCLKTLNRSPEAVCRWHEKLSMPPQAGVDTERRLNSCSALAGGRDRGSWMKGQLVRLQTLCPQVRQTALGIHNKTYEKQRGGESPCNNDFPKLLKRKGSGGKRVQISGNTRSGLDVIVLSLFSTVPLRPRPWA